GVCGPRTRCHRSRSRNEDRALELGAVRSEFDPDPGPLRRDGSGPRSEAGELRSSQTGGNPEKASPLRMRVGWGCSRGTAPERSGGGQWGGHARRRRREVPRATPPPAPRTGRAMTGPAWGRDASRPDGRGTATPFLGASVGGPAPVATEFAHAPV